MKSILKKVAGLAITAVLALGMFSCSNGSSENPVLPAKGTVATPVFSVAAGEVESGTSITITCTTEGSKIYYTTDESAPTLSSTGYTAAISITEAVTIKAIAVKDGMNDSAVVSACYTIKGTVATPAFSIESGAIDSGTTVIITCTTEGAKIYYTTDGSAPTASSTEYTAAISVTSAVTIKAIAVKDGMNDSAVAGANYTIRPSTPNYSTCAVGDFILKDGKILSNDEIPESGTVAAVIVRAAADGKPALGVGIVHNKNNLDWCSSYASGYSTNITSLQGTTTSGYIDGCNSWDLLVAVCEDLKNATAETIETVANRYSAFNYCRRYGVKNGLEGVLANGWYLPTVAELYTIYKNKEIVNSSLSKTGGSQFEGTYWSCCQDSDKSYARILLNNGSMSYYKKHDDYSYHSTVQCICAVRVFD